MKKPSLLQIGLMLVGGPVGFVLLAAAIDYGRLGYAHLWPMFYEPAANKFPNGLMCINGNDCLSTNCKDGPGSDQSHGYCLSKHHECAIPGTGGMPSGETIFGFYRYVCLGQNQWIRKELVVPGLDISILSDAR